MIGLAIRVAVVAFLVHPRADLPTEAHPLHTTMTEVQEQPGTPWITVTVRGFADDLSLGASRFAHLPVGAVSGMRGDSVVAAYLLTRVSLHDRSGQSLPLSFQGARRTADVLWFTFRAQVPGGISGFSILNQALCEIHEDQVNIVQVLRGTGRQSLLFTPGAGRKTIS